MMLASPGQWDESFALSNSESKTKLPMITGDSDVGDNI